MFVNHDVSHEMIFHQVKMKVKQLIAPALRPSTSQLQAGIVRGNRQLDETFDVTHERKTPEGGIYQETLFRVQIKLTKFPNQLSSKTVSEIIDCLRVSLDPSAHHPILLPTIQGHQMVVSWHQQVYPAPLLLLEQFKGGYNLPFTQKGAQSSTFSQKNLAGVS